MNYNKYAALNKRNRRSYHKAVGGGKYGTTENKNSSKESKEDLMKRILQEALAKKAAFNESLKLQEGK